MRARTGLIEISGGSGENGGRKFKKKSKKIGKFEPSIELETTTMLWSRVKSLVIIVIIGPNEHI